jgi:hypothetical protein
MIWLAWRQHRKQAMFTVVGFAVLAALMILIALSMRHTFADLGLPNCVRQMAQADVPPATRDACDAAFHRFTNRYGSLNLVAVLLLILPMLVGLFCRKASKGQNGRVLTRQPVPESSCRNRPTEPKKGASPGDRV